VSLEEEKRGPDLKKKKKDKKGKLEKDDMSRTRETASEKDFQGTSNA